MNNWSASEKSGCIGIILQDNTFFIHDSMRTEKKLTKNTAHYIKVRVLLLVR